MSHPRPDQALSPKRPSLGTVGLADIFPYYAGFSYEWARSLLGNTDSPPNLKVLDPWNGSGTTTLAAQSIGLSSIGVDLNPVANIVASLRTGHRRENTYQDLKRPAAKAMRFSATDPLLTWFDPPTAARLRQWAHCVGAKMAPEIWMAQVALFRVIRRTTDSFRVSNPTWIRQRRAHEDLISLDVEDLDKLVIEEYEYIRSRISKEPTYNVPANVITGTVDSLPVRNEAVDIVLTSPPYFTRIDYAVAYARELAVLGIDIKADRALRSRLMGTTLIRPSVEMPTPVSRTARALLKAIGSHSSKASSGYYLKQARQYLSDLIAGLDELTRVTREGGMLHMVVQDSYYKDIHVALADICIEELQQRGWTHERRKDYPVKRILTSLNPSARSYDKGQVCEIVMSFKRERRIDPRY